MSITSRTVDQNSFTVRLGT